MRFPVPDVAPTLRSLHRRPALALAIVATVALAVGVPTALFTLANGIILQPVPGVSSRGLVNVYVTKDGVVQGFSGHSYAAFREFAEQSATVSSLAAFTGRGFAIDRAGEAELVMGQLVSSRFFETLGTQPALGRLLDARDATRGGATTAVISHERWRRQFDLAPSVIGAPLRINQQIFTIVGVAERGFRGHFIGFPSDVFLPLEAAPLVATDLALDSRADTSLEIVGRVADNATLDGARADLQRIGQHISRQHPSSDRNLGIGVEPWSGLDADLRGSVIGFVGVLALVALLVLTVACLNAGALLAQRIQSRRREIAVRQALGASRPRLLSWLCTETFLLFGAGGAAGLWLATACLALLQALLPATPLPVQLDLSVNWRVAMFAIAATSAAAAVFGIAPVVRAVRLDIVQSLSRQVGDTRRRSWARRGFVATQVALSLTLLGVSAAFTSALRDAASADNGVETSRLGIAVVDQRLLGRTEAAGRLFFDDWIRRATADPAVAAAALTRALPLDFTTPTTTLRVDARGGSDALEVEVGWSAVTPGYFDTLGIPLTAGRPFAASDHERGERVAIVSRHLAARLFPGDEALGRFLLRGTDRLRIVGVAGDVAVHRPGARDVPFFYVPFSQNYGPRMTLVARGRLETPLDSLRRAARDVDPALPVLTVEPLASRLAVTLFPQRMAAAVTGAFGLLGLGLSTLAVYAVVAFAATQRRREIALRLTLGATAGDVRRLVAIDGLGPAAAGLAVGLVCALVGVDLAQRLVPSMHAASLISLAMPALLMAMVAAAAADVPARRAARTDPALALRDE